MQVNMARVKTVRELVVNHTTGELDQARHVKPFQGVQTLFEGWRESFEEWYDLNCFLKKAYLSDIVENELEGNKNESKEMDWNTPIERGW